MALGVPRNFQNPRIIVALGPKRSEDYGTYLEALIQLSLMLILRSQII
jgi:hypothetical protein